ncbi:hypothetical protein GQ42DRAFT_88774 [Ramicandelaber brevisporus]|nr:hypothetical protein GQ42DRAFT_88774 [Ramicandelaber brevisporus]
MKVLFVAAALFAALAIACKSKADCNKHGLTTPDCVKGKCYDKTCKNKDSSHCPPHTKCFGKTCFRSPAKKGEHCDEHEDCNYYLWCSQKKCVAQKPVGSACKADIECHGYPSSGDLELPIYARCQNERCKTYHGRCSSKNDCMDDVPCKSITDDGSEKLCTHESAVGDKCKGSVNCFGPLVCHNGRCVEPKYKKIGEPCKGNPDCLYGCGHDKKCLGPPKGGCVIDKDCEKHGLATPICCPNGKCAGRFRWCE